MPGDLGCEFKCCPLPCVGVVLGFQRGVPYGAQGEQMVLAFAGLLIRGKEIEANRCAQKPYLNRT
ncbi:hypothetical protein JHY03_71110 (plasmid) [Streptomyces sp. CA-256286]|nr:hypothetical protein JHY03_71110 [Streptomyces sp. CA-256286]